ncbi:peptidase M50 [Verrucomicrobiota bacterium]|nr:peptidase M50 [Verrucomicrobiota bacterium]
MDSRALYDGLIAYLCFLPLLTFHEFAHAWTAWKLGDDTAHSQGRVTVNPISHMEVVGTVVLPMLAIFLSAAGSGAANFIIGWGRPVPVIMSRLGNPRRDDTLVALAGPAMNLALAVIILAVAKLGRIAGIDSVANIAIQMAWLSLVLCFFNLLPIPPLDGSHALKNLIGMSEETYLRLCQYGFLAVIIAIQIPFVRDLVGLATHTTFNLIVLMLGFPSGN